MVTIPARRRFTVDDLHDMAAAGIIGPEERVELIEGVIYQMAPQGSPHAACVSTVGAWFSRRFDEADAIVRIQSPISLSPRSEPEPDITLVRWRAGRYADRHPAPGDVLLVIEVSDTSLAYDRRIKARRYAAAGVQEVWVIDLKGRRVFVLREPRDERYIVVTIHQGGEHISPLAFPDLSVPVDVLLP